MNFFNTTERKGVVFLLTLIVVLQLLYFFVDFSSKKEISLESVDYLSFQKEIDSLKQIEIEKRKPKIYPFNPSFITDYKGHKLGMNTEEIDKLLAHRKAGKYINSTKEFQQITGVNDSLLAVISPYFKFPDWVTRKHQKPNFNKKSSYVNSSRDKAYANKKSIFTGPKTDLNIATAAQLQEVRGIGVRLADRIIKYRGVLQGYSYDDQLYEVWYLDKEVADRVMQRFTVIKKPKIQQINVNTARFKQVLHLPYIDYELTKKIFAYRDEMAEIQSLDELKKIDSFPVDKFDRISLYLKAE